MDHFVFTKSQVSLQNTARLTAPKLLYLSPVHSAYRILSVKNARTWVSIDFKYDKFLAPRTIEKIKILGAVFELPAIQHCQFGPFTKKLGKGL